ncbi:MAG TPA: alpha-glucuronidase family glycosyl hydrolase, partial [Cyclobacteriaceae bacterium]
MFCFRLLSVSRITLLLIILFVFSFSKRGRAEDGYRLWLRYDLVNNSQKLKEYRNTIKSILIQSESPTLSAAASELESGLNGLLGSTIKKISLI